MSGHADAGVCAPGGRGTGRASLVSLRSCLAAAAIVVGLVVLSGCNGGTATPQRATSSHPERPNAPAPSLEPQARPARLVVRRRILRLVDRDRTITRRSGRMTTRHIRTVVRYPVVVGGTPAQRAERFPLIVFAHGYALTPVPYRRLLLTWARAGYVVAAPVFPGENAHAPGGPDRGDLLNQPGDVRFVIARLMAASRRAGNPLSGVIDPDRVAVAGHSDGGNTALAVAYDARFRSRRVGAAVILAGADLPGIAPFDFPRRGPPLLAVQGDSDAINPPSATAAYYQRAPEPKFLLRFLRAGHFGPYMTRSPEVRILARVRTAFLDQSLKDVAISRGRLARLGRRSGISVLQVDARG